MAAERRWLSGWRGHLATFRHAEEEEFVYKIVGLRGQDFSWWIGGYRDKTAPAGDPSGGWRWVTGEPWSYTNWLPGQPDNAAGTEVGLSVDGTDLWFGSTRPALWEDSAGQPARTGYVIEFEPIIPAAPTPPSAPAGPRDLTAQLLPGGKVRLSWSDASADESRFTIWRKMGAGEWVQRRHPPGGQHQLPG